MFNTKRPCTHFPMSWFLFDDFIFHFKKLKATHSFTYPLLYSAAQSLLRDGIMCKWLRKTTFRPVILFSKQITYVFDIVYGILNAQKLISYISSNLTTSESYCLLCPNFAKERKNVWNFQRFLGKEKWKIHLFVYCSHHWKGKIFKNRPWFHLNVAHWSHIQPADYWLKKHFHKCIKFYWNN